MHSTSYAAQMWEVVSHLGYIQLAGGIFCIGVIACVGAMLCWIKGRWKKPPCPRATCQSTDVERFTLPNDPIRLVHYRCRMCDHEWQSGPTLVGNH